MEYKSFKPQLVHMPYMYSKSTIMDDGGNVFSYPGVYSVDQVVKYNAIKDSHETYYKILTETPTTIYDMATQTGLRNAVTPNWESKIKYVHSYFYDNGLVFGLPYEIIDNKLIPVFGEKIDVKIENRKLKSDLIGYFSSILSSPTFPITGVVAVDFEADPDPAHPTTVPDPAKANRPITAFSLVADNVKKVFTLSDVKNEAKLLTTFFDEIAPYKIVVTYNGSGWDFRYLRQRLLNLGLDYYASKIRINQKFESDISLPPYDALISGKIHLDLMKFYARPYVRIYAFNEKYFAHSLQEVSMAVLNRGKLDPTLDLGKYCLNDSVLTFDLFLKVYELLVMLCRITNQPIDSIANNNISTILRSLFMWIQRRYNYIIPSPADYDEKNQLPVPEGKGDGKLKGPWIYENPKPGIYIDVSVLDFTGLHPTCIDLHNISYETVHCSHKNCESNLIPEHNFHICLSKEGLFSAIIGALRELRMNYFKKGTTTYQILKVLLNAAFGTLSSEKIKDVYVRPVGSAILAYARKYGSGIYREIEASGVRVIYGDVDSSFLLGATDKFRDDLIAKVKNESGFTLAFDKHFKVLILATKKHYIGIKDDGTFDIKGMQGKKRNSFPYGRKVFQNILDMLKTVQTDKDIYMRRDDIKSFCYDAVRRLKNKEVQIEDLIVSVRLHLTESKRPNQSYIVRDMYKEYGQEKELGESIGKIQIIGDHKAKPWEFAKITEVDWEKYIEYLETILSQILVGLGIDFKKDLYMKKGMLLDHYG